MRWLITLKTEDGLIVPCRLMNAFRCKGLKIVTLAMAARPCGYSMMAVVEPPEADADYIFNFLRRMGGVQSVVINKKPPSAEKEEYEIVFFAPPAPK